MKNVAGIALTVVFALALLLVFVFADFKGRPNMPKPESSSQKKEVRSFDIRTFIQAQTSNSHSPDSLQQLIDAFDKNPSAERANGLVLAFEAEGAAESAAYFAWQKALNSRRQEDYLQAGDRITIVTETPQTDTAFFSYIVPKGIEMYQMALAQDTGSEVIKVNIARLQMDGGIDIMSGVQTLLAITRKNEQNADAQLLLGKYNIVNGQLDKAIARLEKVLYSRPSDAEAHLYMAQAYEGMGNFEKAIEFLEKTKLLVNDKAFIKSIDEHIMKLKQQAL